MMALYASIFDLILISLYQQNNGEKNARNGNKNHLRCKKQSYLKHRRQNNVWNECKDCSRETFSAFAPSILGVHSGRRSGSTCSVSLMYLASVKVTKLTLHDLIDPFTQSFPYFSRNSSSFPLLGKQELMLWKITGDGNGFSFLISSSSSDLSSILIGVFAVIVPSFLSSFLSSASLVSTTTEFLLTFPSEN